MQINNHDHSSQTCTALHTTHPPPHTRLLCVLQTYSWYHETNLQHKQFIKMWNQLCSSHWWSEHIIIIIIIISHENVHIFQFYSSQLIFLQHHFYFKTPPLFTLLKLGLHSSGHKHVTGRKVPEVSKGHTFGSKPWKNKAQCQFSGFGCSSALNYTWRTMFLVMNQLPCDITSHP
jgi:hypothetical protein